MTDYKWYGHFNADSSYTITEPETPRHWYNYFFNDEYVSFTSQVGFGEGVCQDDLGRRIQLFSNRNIFLAEGGAYWSLFGLPLDYGYTDYSCDHECGSSTIHLTYKDIASDVRMFVPNEGRREIWSITLTNKGDEARILNLVSYAKTEVDGTYRPQAYNLGQGGFMEDKKAVWAKDYRPFGSPKNRKIWCYMTSSEEVTGFDSRRNAFIGPYGDEQHPVALRKNGACTGSDCNSEKLCLALQNTVTLAAGETKTIHLQLGVALDPEEIVCPTCAGVDAEFAAMEAKYADVLSGVFIKTPWAEFDHLINGWMKYAADMGSRWARVRHNGYRDMTSDTECLACVNPKLAWERMKRVLTYQYQSGYAPRTFAEGRIKDNNFADNTVWMTYAVNTIIKELGDPSLLYEEVKFNDTEETYSVYEHIKRSVDFLYNFQGLYGLVRIWGGDWNDCINYAGLKGKGVSVWLSIAWVRAGKMFSEVARMLGKEDDAKLADERVAIMTERIDKYGYDEKGGYYIYARTDDDIIMGAADCDEGQIFLNPQLWAVLAGMEKGAAVMDRAEELLETPIGIRLSYPAYSYQRPYIGSMAEKFPGVQDNGGIYLHPSAWKLAVDSLLHRPDRVEEGLRKMLPWDHTYDDGTVSQTCGEPYAMYNSYFAPETGYRAGTPGQSWRTASSSWMLKSVVEFVFGMHPEIEGLRIDPCLPLSWGECSIKKVMRGCTFDVHFTGNGEGSDVLEILVDGEKIEGNVVAPVAGKTIKVDVKLGKK